MSSPISATAPGIMALPMPPTRPAPSRAKESSRSSRRRNQSAGPSVVLGGGVGALGGVSSSMAAPLVSPALSATSGAGSSRSSGAASGSAAAPGNNGERYTSSPFYSPTPATSSPHKFRDSPVVGTYESSPTFTVPRAAPPPVAHPVPSTAPLRINRAKSPTPPVSQASHSSLATTASTSSRTLKTPHAKQADHLSPRVRGESGSLEGPLGYTPSPPVNRMSVVAEDTQRSPTPKERRRSSEKRAAPPALTRSPLPPPPNRESPPPVPIIGPARRSSARPSTAPDALTGRKVPAPLQIQGHTHRLSQDWVQINAPTPPKQKATEVIQRNDSGGLLALEVEPSLPRHNGPSRLPPPQMLPLKYSPVRPTYDRAASEPLAPAPGRQGPPASRPMSTMGELNRSTSPTPPPSTRPRQVSHSTPPAAVLEAASLPAPSTSSAGGVKGLFKGSKVDGAPLKGRKSFDILRPSMDRRPSTDVLRGETKEMSKKELRAAQQRALGAGTPASEEPRKSSGISLKKSSGALKALFNRSGKGKDKEPPMPSVEERSASLGRSTSKEATPRPSISSMGSGRPMTPIIVEPMTAQGAEQAGRTSLGSDRALYPAHPRAGAPPPGQAAMQSPFQGSVRTRLPSRDLPPLPAHGASPAPSPNPGVSTPGSASSTGGIPPSSSLPYLGARRGSETPDQPTASTMPVYRDSYVSPPSAASTASTTTPASPPYGDETPPSPPSPVKPSKSLHLLSLPDLDLSFDFSFDSMNFGGPSTPRKSPRMTSGGSPIKTPQRTMTVSRHISPHEGPETRVRAERRRSKSFDGVAMASAEMWRHPPNSDHATLMKMFNTTGSNSAPVLSKQLSEPLPSLPIALAPTATSPTEPPALDFSAPPSSIAPSHHAQHSVSSSQPSAPSSLDHARTPSNASSANVTESPSPPRTPEEKNTRLPFPAPPVKPVTPTRFEDDFFSLGTPPSIPLPPVPTDAVSLDSRSLSSSEEYGPTSASMSASTSESQQTTPTAPIETPKRLTPPPAISAAPAVEELAVPNAKVDNKVASRARALQTRSRLVAPDPSRSTKVICREIEGLLYTFRYPAQSASSADRAAILRNELLPLMHEVEKRPFDHRDEATNSALREACFDWAEALMLELRVEQPANERGACLEGLAGVVESSCLSERALSKTAAHRQKFKGLMIKCMSFVMSKLGAKGVFHNTLLFSGRFLAFAFFRVPHIGEQLVTVLQPPRGALARFTRPILLGAKVPSEATPAYPAHLLPLCFDDARSYTTRLASLSADFATEAEREAFLFTPGNWLRRWQSDDSELFPAFYRAYHRQLAQYLAPVVQYYEVRALPVPASILLRAPGYAHLATIFAKKCHSYILGSVNAVTTSSSAQNFEATETAGFRSSQKPPVLETANRRLVETLSTFANLKMLIPASAGILEVDGTQLWGDMIDVWAKNLIAKTSLYAPKGVFSLFDLLDGIVDPPYETAAIASLDTPMESLLDVPYLINVIRMVLREGEHALTLVKVIAFVFTHWEVLTANAADRRALCLELLLEKELFERLLLFWSQSVRSYILRLVVFRLGHLHTRKEDGVSHEVEIESVKLLQSRLDRIKKRHDELEPKPSSDIVDLSMDLNPPLTPLSGSMPRSRSTITMVQDSPRTGSSQKAERLLGLGFGDEGLGTRGEIEETKMGKAGKWFKKLGGTKSKKRRDGTDSANSSPMSTSSAGDSPLFVPYTSPSPNMRGTPRFATPSLPRSAAPSPSPLLASPEIDDSPSRAPRRLPVITTTATSPALARTPDPSASAGASALSTPGADRGLHSPSAFAFEFELPTMSPRSDTFDPPAHTPASPRRQSQPPSPRAPTSPHMSRSFSKRSSLLPPSTASALEEIMSVEHASPALNAAQAKAKDEERKKREAEEAEDRKGYDKKSHAYAIRMLAELEDAQKEYDEWWSDGGIGRTDGAPPRLTVAWPFHEGED